MQASLARLQAQQDADRHGVDMAVIAYEDDYSYTTLDTAEAENLVVVETVVPNTARREGNSSRLAAAGGVGA